MSFQLPSIEEMRRTGGLSPEVAGEGDVVQMFVSKDVVYVPPPKPIYPDMSQMGPIKHLFYPKRYEAFPVILHHPTEGEREVKDAAEAKALGVICRKPTAKELADFPISADRPIWQTMEGSLWRIKPYGEPKFDPSRPDTGKCFQAPYVDPATMLSRMLAQTDRQSSAAQTAVLEKMAEAIAKALARGQPAEAPAPAPVLEPQPNALAETASAKRDVTREYLETQAAEFGIKVDGRWSTAKLAEKIEEHRGQG